MTVIARHRPFGGRGIEVQISAASAEPLAVLTPEQRVRFAELTGALFITDSPGMQGRRGPRDH